jgi:ribosomal protein S19
LGHLFFNKTTIIKNNKPLYYSSSMWRSIYLISSNPVYHTREKKIYNRSTVIPTVFSGHEILVHSGKRWHTRWVNDWMVGCKAGEFTWNRKYALYKAKQMRKKKNKNKK